MSLINTDELCEVLNDLQNQINDLKREIKPIIDNVEDLIEDMEVGTKWSCPNCDAWTVPILDLFDEDRWLCTECDHVTHKDEWGEEEVIKDEESPIVEPDKPDWEYICSKDINHEGIVTHGGGDGHWCKECTAPARAIEPDTIDRLKAVTWSHVELAEHYVAKCKHIKSIQHLSGGKIIHHTWRNRATVAEESVKNLDSRLQKIYNLAFSQGYTSIVQEILKFKQEENQ